MHTATKLNIVHIDDKRRALLREVFLETLQGECLAWQFRAGHADTLDVLDDLETRRLLHRDGVNNRYRVELICLPSLNMPESNELLRDLDVIYSALRRAYESCLTHPISMMTLSDVSSLPTERLAFCVPYIDDLRVLSTKPIDFRNGSVAPSEDVLRLPTFEDALARREDWLRTRNGDPVETECPKLLDSLGYTTDLLEILKLAIRDHFEGQAPDNQPKKEVLVRVLVEQHGISTRSAIAIDHILRHSRRKIGGNRKLN